MGALCACPGGSCRCGTGSQLSGRTSGYTGSRELGVRQRVASSGRGAAQRRQDARDEELGPEWRSELQPQIPPNLLRDLGVVG